MKRILIIGAAGAAAVITAAVFVAPRALIEARASVDRKTALVGQKFAYRLEIVKAKAVEADTEGAMAGAEAALKEFTVLDSKRIFGSGLMKDRETLIFEIASYDTGRLTIAPVSVRYRPGGAAAWREAEAAGLSVTVESLVAKEPLLKQQIRMGGGLAGGPRSAATEAAGGDKPLDPARIASYTIKDQSAPIEVLTAREIAMRAVLWGAAAGAAILTLFIGLALYLNRPRPVTPPDAEARAALLGLAGQVEGRKISAKEFYSRLISITAAYLTSRFSLPKAEMTKTEILSAVEAIPETGPAVREDLRAMLAKAESVRYFGGDADSAQMTQDIEKVRGLIDATKPAVERGQV